MRYRIYRLGIIAISFFAIVNIALSKENGPSVPLIGDSAPSFTALTTKGEINFPEDYWNKWVVLFSHPADFTPVCTSELMCFAELHEEFKNTNCELLGLSVDGVNSHIQWIKEIEHIEFNGMKDVKIEYPLIADQFMEVSKKFGMIHPSANSSKTIRGVYIIDDNQKIQAILMYPMMSGRNVKEILRLVKALQTADDNNVATPEGWQPGDDVFLAPIFDKELAMDRYDKIGDDYNCAAWFMCTKKGNW